MSKTRRSPAVSCGSSTSTKTIEELRGEGSGDGEGSHALPPSRLRHTAPTGYDASVRFCQSKGSASG